MASLPVERGNSENLKLQIRNTFFHVEDVAFEAHKAQFVKRSASDSSLGSKSAHSQSLSSEEFRPEPALLSQVRMRQTHANSGAQSSWGGECPEHLVWRTPDSSVSAAGSESSSSRQSSSNQANPPFQTGGVKVGAAQPRQLATSSHMEKTLVNISALPVQSALHGLDLHAASSAAQQTLEQIPVPNQEQINQGAASTSLENAPECDGTCRPCIFFSKSQCSNGNACPYCHTCPMVEKTSRNRPSKKTRESRAKHLAERNLSNRPGSESLVQAGALPASMEMGEADRSNDEDMPAISHSQLHHLIDIALEQCWEQVGSKAASHGVSKAALEDVTETMKQTLPCGTELGIGNEEPTFSQRQVQRVLQLLGEQFGQAMAEKCDQSMVSTG